jgi:hypothetical protein
VCRCRAQWGEKVSQILYDTWLEDMEAKLVEQDFKYAQRSASSSAVLTFPLRSAAALLPVSGGWRSVGLRKISSARFSPRARPMTKHSAAMTLSLLARSIAICLRNRLMR